MRCHYVIRWMPAKLLHPWSFKHFNTWSLVFDDKSLNICDRHSQGCRLPPSCLCNSSGFFQGCGLAEPCEDDDLKNVHCQAGNWHCYMFFPGGKLHHHKNVSYMFPGGSHFSKVKGVGIMHVLNVLCIYYTSASDIQRLIRQSGQSESVFSMLTAFGWAGELAVSKLWRHNFTSTHSWKKGYLEIHQITKKHQMVNCMKQQETDLRSWCDNKP